jgi:hypothetical protein
MNDESSIGGIWTNVALANVLDLYEEDGVNLISLAYHSSIRLIFTSNTIVHCQRSCHKEQIKNKIEKIEGEYQHKKLLFKEQIKVSRSTWPWFV